MTMANPHNYVLEPAAQAFSEATSEPPFLYELPPSEGRSAVEKVQNDPIEKPDVDEEWIEVDSPKTPGGKVKVRILNPWGKNVKPWAQTNAINAIDISFSTLVSLITALFTVEDI